MANKKTRLKKRNTHIVLRYRYYRKKNPKWMSLAVIQEVADEMFLSPSTIARILIDSEVPKIPSADTVIKHMKDITM
jgi:hypothetical protein